MECILIHIGISGISRGIHLLNNHLIQNNIKSQILVLNKTNYENEIQKIRKNKNVKLFGFSLHWHPQIIPTIKMAELIKNMYGTENIKILLGGITASFFAENLIQFSFIDYIIKGDGYYPLELLCKHVNNNSIDIKSIPNLYYKVDNVVYQNNFNYSACDKDISDLEISTLKSNIPNYEFGSIGLGRGCDQNCVYCGGSKSAYSIWGGENKTLIRTKKAINKIINEFKKQNISELYFASDHDGQCKLICECLSEIDLSSFKMIKIEAWGLPDMKKLKSIFRNTTSPNKINITLLISPESGDEKIRFNSKTFAFTNSELESFLFEFYKTFNNSNIILYFGYYLPFNEKDNLVTRKYIFNITNSFYNQFVKSELFICCNQISTDPGSKIYNNEVPGIVNKIDNFNDYFKHLKEPFYDLGEFQTHLPKNLNRQEYFFYLCLFNYENYMRVIYPKLYKNLISLFNSFEEYNKFYIKHFKSFYNVYLKTVINSKLLQHSILYKKLNLFGFNKENHTHLPSNVSIIIWLNYFKEKILENKNGLINKIKSVELNNSDINYYQDLYTYITDLLELIITKESYYKVKSQIKDVYYHNMVKFNYSKIINVQKNSLRENCCPIKNPLFKFVQFNSQELKKSPISLSDNLKLLGKDFFTELLHSVKEEKLSNEIINDCYTILKVDNFNEILNNIEKYWFLSTKKENIKISSIISKIIISKYIPHKLLIKEFRSNTFDINKLQIHYYYGLFSDLCDIRLINFYLNYQIKKYNLSCRLISDQSIKGIYFNYYNDITSNEDPLILFNGIKEIELKLIELCNGLNSVSQITYDLCNCYKDINEKYVVDILILFYQLQIIY